MQCPHLVKGVITICRVSDRPYILSDFELTEYCESKSYQNCHRFLSLIKKILESLYRAYNKKPILIVNSDYHIRELLSLILKKEGYDIIEAFNGKHALDKLRSTTVQMVITDLQMPFMDGIELTKELRNTAEYDFIPIIMLATEFRESKKEEGKQAGINEWIEKPFIPKHLLDVVSSLHYKKASIKN